MLLLSASLGVVRLLALLLRCGVGIGVSRTYKRPHQGAQVAAAQARAGGDQGYGALGQRACEQTAPVNLAELRDSGGGGGRGCGGLRRRGEELRDGLKEGGPRGSHHMGIGGGAGDNVNSH
jgi:hypothetical protein